MTAIADHIAAARAELADTLQYLSPAARIELATAACIENGGSLVPANICKGTPHYAEISLLGVYHAGNDEAEAIANWIKAVRRIEAAAPEAA